MKSQGGGGVRGFGGKGEYWKIGKSDEPIGTKVNHFVRE